MKIIWASVVAEMQLFKEERAAGFATWSRLPEYHRLACVPLWRELGEHADVVYSTERFELCRRFNLDPVEWTQRCGPIDIDGFATFRQRRKLALVLSPRSAVIDTRSEKQALRVVEEITQQLVKANIISGSSSEVPGCMKDLSFRVGSVSLEQRVISVASGVRVQLAAWDSDAVNPHGVIGISHSLAYIDSFGVLTDDELSAVKSVADRSAARFRLLLSRNDAA